MKLQFRISYRTSWGEEVCVDLTSYNAAGKATQKIYSLTTDNGEYWIGEVKLPQTAKRISYFYVIRREGVVTRVEWDVTKRLLPLGTGERTYIFFDAWKDIPYDSYLYSSAFTDSFFQREREEEVQLEYSPTTILLRVSAPQLRGDERLVLVGNQDAFGNWNVEKGIPMHEIQPNEFIVALDPSKFLSPVEYKYVSVDSATGELRAWEQRDNRRLQVPSLQNKEVQLVTEEPVNLPYPQWKGAGCVIPVFSLRTRDSYGVGDFGDLKKMIDWVALTGQRVLQILPINDTTITNTWTDSYPYNSISIYAFHPQYVCLSALPSLKDKNKAALYEKRRLELNGLPQIDYEAVNKLKRAYLRDLYEQEGEALMESEGFKEFFSKNEVWLAPYAVFSVLRDQYGTPDFRTWKTNNVYNEKEVKALCRNTSKLYSDICFYYYVQYLLHVQLLEASEYGHQKGVVIKGDIPIGISRNSVEAWVEPYYFNMNGQAGAPPDAFSVNGQNWGFPTYNWDAMLEDGCQWWLRRFHKMAEYFDAYRIDHVLGFFRIWEIPLDSVHGLLGQFSPAIPMYQEEIESYGLRFRPDFFTRPFITDWIVNEVFGDFSQEVFATYLDHIEANLFKMKPEYDTQRKVEAVFKGKNDPKSITIRDGLYSLISDVLFVHDRKDPRGYHPRISAQNDYLYKTLPDDQKAAFNRLYNEYFYRRHDQFWYTEAMKKLPVLTKATRMLVCAEDLGMVPNCVPWVMDELRILTLEIQSMPKNPKYKFGNLAENPYRSVDTISTHDMSTLRGWWEEDWELSQSFYNEALQKDGPAPHPMPGWLAEEIISRHLFCPSMLALMSLQDWLSMDEKLRLPDPNAERINVPANPRHYWRYRMHLTIEELLASTDFNNKVKTLVERSGR